MIIKKRMIKSTCEIYRLDTEAVVNHIRILLSQAGLQGPVEVVIMKNQVTIVKREDKKGAINDKSKKRFTEVLGAC